jgi:hypothetical protein
MKNYCKSSLPKDIAKILDERDINEDDTPVLLGSISNGNIMKRALLYILYELCQLWARKESKSNRALKSDFAGFLKKKGVEISPSDLTRMLQACEVEKIIGAPIGTFKEGVLRALTPLLAGNNEGRIVEAWDAALLIAKKKKPSATHKSITIKHVEKALKRDEFSGLIKKRGPKSAKENDVKDDALLTIGNGKKRKKDSEMESHTDEAPLPIGNEKRQEKYDLIEELCRLVSKLKARKIRLLIKKTEKYIEEQKGGQ